MRFTTYEIVVHHNKKNKYVTQNHDAAYIVNTRLHFDVSPSIRLSFWSNNITDQYPEKNIISSARSGTIKGIVDSPKGYFSIRAAPRLMALTEHSGA